MTAKGSRLGGGWLTPGPPGEWRGPFAWLLGLVASASTIADLAKVEMDIKKWGGHRTTVMKVFRETFSVMVKVGIILQKLPEHAHDFVVQALGSKVQHDETMKRMRTSRSPWYPAPLPPRWMWGIDVEDVGAVSMNTLCHACHGWGQKRSDRPIVAANGGRNGQGYCEGSGEGLQSRGQGRTGRKWDK